MANKTDTSKDGWKNKLQTMALTSFDLIWDFIQSNDDRELCQYPRVTDFVQISSDEKVHTYLCLSVFICG